MSANGTILLDSRLIRTMPERMNKALDVYQKLTAQERLLPDNYDWPDPAEMRGATAPSVSPGFIGCQDDYPDDGLVLHAYYRDLPRSDFKYLDRIHVWDRWVKDCWNQDFAWFQRDEMLGFLPASLRSDVATPIKGERFEVSKSNAVKLARYHLKDMVSGREMTWPKEAVSKAQLTGEVMDIAPGRVSVRFEGIAEMDHEGTWGSATNVIAVRRTLKANLLGYGTYSIPKQKFVSFELIAMGTRAGAGPFNMRWKTDDRAPNPMGILFTLAGDSPAERIRPGCDYRD